MAGPAPLRTQQAAPRPGGRPEALPRPSVAPPPVGMPAYIATHPLPRLVPPTPPSPGPGPVASAKEEDPAKIAEGAATSKAAAPSDKAKAAAGAGAASAKGTPSAIAAAPEQKAVPPAGARKSPLAAPAKPGDMPEEPVLAPEPVTETGSVRLPALSFARPAITAAFDAPRSLEVRPNAPPAKPTPATERYEAVFAEAVSSAMRLQAEILATAEQGMGAAADAAVRRHAAAQQELDRGLAVLDMALAQGRNAIEGEAAAASLRIDQSSAQAKEQVEAATRRAYGALAARKKTMRPEIDAIRKEKCESLANYVSGGIASIAAAGNQASAALTALADNPASEYPDSGTKLEIAENEEKRDRIAKRSKAQASSVSETAKLYTGALTPFGTSISKRLTEVMEPLEARYAALSNEAPAAVATARRQALQGLARQTRGLQQALRSGRAASMAALVQQHRAARRQLIESSGQRARGQAEQAEARASQQAAAARGMARGAPAGVRALHQSIADQKGRPPDQFAQLVIAASQGFSRQLTQSGQGQLQGFRQSQAIAARSLDDSAVAADGRLAGSAVQAGERIRRSGEDTAAELGRQIEDQLPAFAEFAPPVSRAIEGYLPPLAKAFAEYLKRVTEEIASHRCQAEATFTGIPCKPKEDAADAKPADSAASTESEPQAGKKAPPPFTFRDQLLTIAKAPAQQEAILSYVKAISAAVQRDVRSRANGIRSALSGFTTSVDAVFRELRGLTLRRAAALEAEYLARNQWDLRVALQFGFRNTFSLPKTIRLNTAAAMAYLDGRAAEGARLELEESVYLWNEPARAEAAQRALTPAQMDELQKLPGAAETIADVRNDLEGTDRKVFDALQAKDTALADALRLSERIDEARKKRGWEGADATVDVISEASKAGPTGTLAGVDPLGLDPNPETAQQHWEAVQDKFAQLHPLAQSTEIGPVERGAALVAYATREQTYVVQTGGGGPEGSVEFETVTENIEGRQKQLITALVRHGEGSPEARAARMGVEDSRPGKPDLSRLDKATWDPRANPELNPNQTAEERAKTQKEFEKDRALTFQLYAQQFAPELAGQSTEQIRKALGDKTAGKFAGDPYAAAYARSLVEQDMPDAVAAFDYAVEGAGTHTDVLRRTLGRLRQSQVDEAVRRYDEKARARGAPGLYARLGVYGKGNWFAAELSGEEREEMEQALLGVAVTDRERAVLAALKARQQLEGTGFLGKAWNTLTGEQARLENDYGDLLKAMGARQGDFDEYARLRVHDPITGKPVGNFNAEGKFTPTDTTSLANFQAAMDYAEFSAASYKASIDRFANAVAIGLVIAAAVLSTALTGGAAASIWIPVLTTLGAGLVGIAANFAIKGDRYGFEDAMHDLAIAVVQAATAGLGAAVGTALRGGMPALRAVAGSMKLAEEGGELLLASGGRIGLRTLGLADEIFIGSVTTGFGSMGQAALDPEAFHKGAGAFLQNIGQGAFHGLVSGSAGALASGVMRPLAGRMGLGAGGTRALAAGAAGIGTRGAELGLDPRARGAPGDVAGELFWAGLQNAAQGRLEHTFDPAHRQPLGARPPVRAPTEVAEVRGAAPHPTPSAEPAAAPPRPPPEMAEAPVRPPAGEARPPPAEAPLRLPEEPRPAAPPAAVPVAEAEPVAARRPLPAEEEAALTPRRAEALEEAALHPELAGTAAAVPGAELFRGDVNANVPGNAEHIARLAAEFQEGDLSRLGAARDPQGAGLVMEVPGPPPRRIAVVIEAGHLPGEGGAPPVAGYRLEPGGPGFDARYVVTVSAQTHPDNVAPGLGHELREIRTVEQRRAHGESPALAMEGTPGRLSAHEAGQLEQLRVRHEQIAAEEARMAGLAPDAPARTASEQRLRSLRQDADDLLVHLGALAPTGQVEPPGLADRRRLLAAAPELDAEGRLALERQIEAAQARRSAPPEAAAPVVLPEVGAVPPPAPAAAPEPAAAPAPAAPTKREAQKAKEQELLNNRKAFHEAERTKAIADQREAAAEIQRLHGTRPSPPEEIPPHLRTLAARDPGERLSEVLEHLEQPGLSGRARQYLEWARDYWTQRENLDAAQFGANRARAAIADIEAELRGLARTAAERRAEILDTFGKPTDHPALEAAISGLDPYGKAYVRQYAAALADLEGRGVTLKGLVEGLRGRSEPMLEDMFRTALRKASVEVLKAVPPAERAAVLQQMLAAQPNNSAKGHLFNAFRKENMPAGLKPIKATEGGTQIRNTTRFADGVVEITEPREKAVRGPTEPGSYLAEDKAGPGAFDLKQAENYSKNFTAEDTIKTADGKTHQGVLYFFDDFAAADNARRQLDNNNLHRNIRVAYFNRETGSFQWLR